jgi:hypothetical protein
VVDPRLNLLQQALNRKADAVQREFNAVGEELQALGRQLVSDPPSDTGPLLSEQATLRERQQALAAQINIWRDRARAALRQPDEASLQAFLNDLETAPDAAGDAGVLGAVQTTREFLAHPEQAAALLASAGAAAYTPAGRLLERAHSEAALQADDPAARQREAVEFVNRPGLAQNEQALAELEAGLADSDPTVADVAARTLIQVHRFRALRLGELEPAHQSVRWLARLKHRAVIPVLIEILETPRTGYVPGQTGPLEAGNRRSRLVALAALVEWRTPAAQAAVRARLFDRDPQMVTAAERALALFPGDWQSS